MNGRRPQPCQGLEVHRRGVTLVPTHAIPWVNQLEGTHLPVSGHLGQDRSRRDSWHLAIALDHWRSRYGQLRAAVAIDQGQLRCNVQAFHGALHGQHGRMQDVEAVDFLDFGTGDTEAQRLFPDFVEQRLALGFGELLRIVQAKDRARRVEDHRRRYHRATQWATAHFVDAGDQVLDQVEVQSNLHVSGP